MYGVSILSTYAMFCEESRDVGWFSVWSTFGLSVFGMIIKKQTVIDYLLIDSAMHVHL